MTRFAWLVLFAACSSNSASPEAANADAPKPSSLVQVELVSPVATVSPGADIELAARFHIADGWHIYWDNPGESGLRTTAAFEGPPGTELGPVRYPGPTVFESPGGIRSYGYAKDAALFTTATLPEDVEGPVAFRVDAGWLACRESCIRGTGSATLTLPVTDAATPSAAPVREALAPHRARLPQPWSALSGARAAREGDAVVLHVPAAPDQVTFFPARAQPASIRDVQVSAADGGARVTISLGGRSDAKLSHVAGVVRAGEVYYDVSVPYDQE